MAAGEQVLFIQGGGPGAHDDWDVRLVASLTDALGTGYEVRYPRMPHEADPNYLDWSAAIEHELATAEDGVILVGHSVGGTILIHYLAEAVPQRRIGTVAIIAAPYVGAGGWPSDDFALTDDLGVRLPRGVPVHVFHGLADQTAPPDHAALYRRAIPQAHVHLVSGADHQLNDDLSDVARAIEAERRRHGDGQAFGR